MSIADSPSGLVITPFTSRVTRGSTRSWWCTSRGQSRLVRKRILSVICGYGEIQYGKRDDNMHTMDSLNSNQVRIGRVLSIFIYKMFSPKGVLAKFPLYQCLLKGADTHIYLSPNHLLLGAPCPLSL